MDLQTLKEHMDARFDKVEDKIDGHLERISKSETDISWLKGHVKIVTTIGISILLAAILAAVNLN